MQKRNVVNYWLSNLVYPRLILGNPYLRVFLPMVRFLFNTPLWYIFKYFNLDYKLFSARFDYTNDILRSIIIQELKNNNVMQAKEIYFLHCSGWRKEITFSFLGEHKYPSYIFKIPEDSKEEKRLNNECHLIEKLNLLGPPISRVIPQVIYKGVINNRFAVLESVKEGDSLIKSLFAHRKSLDEIDFILTSIRDWLILLHKKSIVIEEKGDILTLRDIVSNSLSIYKERIFLDEEELQCVSNFLDREICRIRNSPFPFVIQHADFQPNNILFNETNSEIAIFDWEYALEKGLPLIDLLNFLLISLSLIIKDKKIDKKPPHFIPRLTLLKYNLDSSVKCNN